MMKFINMKSLHVTLLTALAALTCTLGIHANTPLEDTAHKLYEHTNKTKKTIAQFFDEPTNSISYRTYVVMIDELIAELKQLSQECAAQHQEQLADICNRMAGSLVKFNTTLKEYVGTSSGFKLGIALLSARKSIAKINEPIITELRQLSKKIEAESAPAARKLQQIARLIEQLLTVETNKLTLIGILNKRLKH